MNLTESINPFIGMLKLFAQLLNNIAEVEEKYGKKYDEIIKEFFTPQNLAELQKKLSPEIYSELMASILKLAALSGVQNPFVLPVDDKKKFASELMSFVKSLEKAAEELKRINN
jgi:hypothetical protein